MDAAERAAFARSLRTKFSDDEAIEADSSSAEEEEAQPPIALRSTGDASSDASTVSPPASPPPDPLIAPHPRRVSMADSDASTQSPPGSPMLHGASNNSVTGRVKSFETPLRDSQLPRNKFTTTAQRARSAGTIPGSTVSLSESRQWREQSYSASSRPRTPEVPKSPKTPESPFSPLLPGKASVVEIDESGIDGWELAQKAATECPADTASGVADSVGAKYPLIEEEDAVFSSKAADFKPVDLSGGANTSGPGVLPGRIVAFLDDFQVDGAAFLYRLYSRNRGGLLADAMGLGKTVQTLCFLGAAFEVWSKGNRKGLPSAKILVVVPTAVTMNWTREFKKWTPFRFAIYSKENEAVLGRSLRRDELDVIIVGEHALRMNHKAFFKNPTGKDCNWKWNLLVVDEIHGARNRRRQLYLALRSLSATAKFGLTGTAVQNNLEELWTVMSIVVPETMWPSYKSFESDFIRPINAGAKRDANERLRGRAARRIAGLRTALSKHFIRRPKSIVASKLPGKVDFCVLMRMDRNGLQGSMYRRLMQSYDVKMLRDANESCDCDSGIKSRECCHRFPMSKEQLRNAPLWRLQHESDEPCPQCPQCIFLRFMHVAQSIARHALLVEPDDDDRDVKRKYEKNFLCEYYMGGAEMRMRPTTELEQSRTASCKLNVALKLLRSFEKYRHKTIIFYESLRLGTILQRWATNNGIVYQVIDGSVSKEGRQAAVDDFNKNSVCSVFLVSKRAGGTGLNICAADRVLIFEPCWNPTLDMQAQDRAYRLGQKRVVQVYRFVTENTIEHYTFKTALHKSQLSNAILDNTDEEWKVSAKEVGTIRAMLSMGEVFVEDSEKANEFKLLSTKEMQGNREDSKAEKLEKWKHRDNKNTENSKLNASRRGGPQKDTQGRNMSDGTTGLEQEGDDGGWMRDDDGSEAVFNNLNVDVDDCDEHWKNAVARPRSSDEDVYSAESISDADDMESVDDNKRSPKRTSAGVKRRLRPRRACRIDSNEEEEDNDEWKLGPRRRNSPDMDDIVEAMPEASQDVTDELLCHGGAAQKLVMFTTAGNEQQVMGRDAGTGGGINASGRAPEDFDDGRWIAPPMTQVDDIEEQVAVAALRRTKGSARAKRKRDVVADAEHEDVRKKKSTNTAAKKGNKKAKVQKTQTEQTKTKTAFGARARVRR